MSTGDNHDHLCRENWDGWCTRPDRWLHTPSQITARLAEASVDNFQQYIGEVLDVFPLDWADRLVNDERATTGDLTAEPLWPGHDIFYKRHPAPRLVSGIMLGRDGVLELAQLGRDLFDTKNLLGIQSIRRDLRVVEQYRGRIFELAVLADFVRAGFHTELTGTPDCKIVVEWSCFIVEIVHRDQHFASHLGNRIWQMLGLHTLNSGSGFHGAITVTLEPGAGGAAEDAYELADKAVEHLVDAARARGVMNVFYPQCRIHYDPRATEMSLTVLSHGNKSHSSVVDRSAYGVLKSKIRQLTQRDHGARGSLIAANFRPLLRPIPAYSKAFPDSSTIKQHDRDRESIIAATLRFLNDYPVVSGVLIWWEQWQLGLDARLMVFGQRPVSLVISSGEISSNLEGLAGLLRAANLLQ